MERQVLSRHTCGPDCRPLRILLVLVAAMGCVLAIADLRAVGQQTPATDEPAVAEAAAPLSGSGAGATIEFATPKPIGTAESEPLPNLIKTDIDLSKAEAILSDVKDGEYGVIEAGSLWLLKQASEMEIARFDPDPPDQEVSFRKLMEAPMLYRGKAVTVSGRVGSVGEFPVEMEQLPSVKKLWKIEIYKPTRGQHAWVCTLMVSEDPGPLKPKQTDVRMKGYFYKLRSYEFEEPNDPEQTVWIQQCPIVVGRYVQVVDQAPKEAPSAGGLMNTKASVMLLSSVIAGILLLLILLLFVKRFIARRQDFTVRPTRELSEQELAERRRFLEQAESDASADDGRSG
ncbi:MAG: hypothetical protein JXL80_03420 [Planctomycetes bacterium]|nr:hypothetical protein [Planctomycetota bacterium]